MTSLVCFPLSSDQTGNREMLVIMTIITDRWNFRVPCLALTNTHSQAIAPVPLRFEPYESNDSDSDDAESEKANSLVNNDWYVDRIVGNKKYY